jgi:hypothetical protein
MAMSVPRPKVLAGIGVGVLLVVGVGVGMAASVDSSRSRGGGPIGASMFGAKPLSRAVKQFRSRVGQSVNLLDVVVESTSVQFLYESAGLEKTYAVTLSGNRPPRGHSLVLNGHAFPASNLHAGVPSALIALIWKRSALAQYVPQLADLGVLRGSRPMWQVLGKTPTRFLIFQADPLGRHLRETCAQPLPKQRDLPIGC